MLFGTVIVAASNGAVAIVAIVVSGVVGVAAPIAAGAFASKRTTRELDAHDIRQERALRAEQDRLERQLTAEAERLKITQAAEDARLADVARREALDQACMALIRFRSITANHKDPSQDLMTLTVEEVATHRARLLLWFKEDAKVVHTYQESLYACAEYAEARKGEKDDGAEAKALEDLEAACKWYFEAARECVSGLS